MNDREEAVLEAIKQSIAKHSYPPTIREISEITGIPSTNTVRKILINLNDMGLIERGEGKARGIRVT